MKMNGLNIKTILVLFLFFIGFFPVFICGAAPEVRTVPQTASAPVIDGILDEDVWALRSQI